MKYSIFVIVFLLAKVSLATEDLSVIRKSMQEAEKDGKMAKEFYKTINSLEYHKPLMLGYRAMAELLLCKHTVNPISKLSHFNAGKELLEKAIAGDATNAELRFYRYCTQINAPGMLNYSSNIKEDKQFLFDFIELQSKNPKKDLDLYTRIKQFLFTNKYASDVDKRKLKEV